MAQHHLSGTLSGTYLRLPFILTPLAPRAQDPRPDRLLLNPYLETCPGGDPFRGYVRWKYCPLPCGAGG